MKHNKKSSPDQWRSLPAVIEVLFVVEQESDVVLAPDQDDGRVGAEPLDLLDPHVATVVQRTLPPHVEAHEDNVGPGIFERCSLNDPISTKIIVNR